MRPGRRLQPLMSDAALVRCMHLYMCLYVMWDRRTSDGQQLVGDADGRLVLVLVDSLLAPFAQSGFHVRVRPSCGEAWTGAGAIKGGVAVERVVDGAARGTDRVQSCGGSSGEPSAAQRSCRYRCRCHRSRHTTSKYRQPYRQHSLSHPPLSPQPSPRLSPTPTGILKSPSLA